MVQMKDLTISIRMNCRKNFISHMVQMKGIVVDRYDRMYKYLYIPHGSDER